MKKVLIFTFSLICITYCHAQKVTEGNLTMLKDKRVNLIVDFSEGTIMGMDETAFAELEQDWEKDKADVLGRIVSNASSKCKNKMVLGKLSKADYSIRIIVRSVSNNGSFLCDGEVLDNAGLVLSRFNGVKGRGGKFGSKLNLIKDGAERTGNDLGSFLNSNVK